jgi:mannose-6-phosphate isomerase-like protein (cupin superfamily)
MQRRVVTEEIDGRSRVASDGPAERIALSQHVWIDDLWMSTVDDRLGYEPGRSDMALTPPPGAIHWRIFSVPPDAAGPTTTPRASSGLEVEVDDGWHKTDTLDYVVVLDGEVTLVLEDGEVELQPGDSVVQRRTNHAWRNRGDSPIRLLAVMVGLEP